MKVDVWGGVHILQDMVVRPDAKIAAILKKENEVWVVRVFLDLPNAMMEFVEPHEAFPSNHLKNQVLLLAG
jgi:hypothetical protein